MNKSKSIIVTVIFAIMLVAIDAFMLKLWIPGFGIVTGALALYGFLKFTQAFSSWLRADEEPLELPVYHNDDDLLPEDFTATVEDIMREVEAEREGVS